MHRSLRKSRDAASCLSSMTAPAGENSEEAESHHGCSPPEVQVQMSCVDAHRIDLPPDQASHSNHHPVRENCQADEKPNWDHLRYIVCAHAQSPKVDVDKNQYKEDGSCQSYRPAPQRSLRRPGPGKHE